MEDGSLLGVHIALGGATIDCDWLGIILLTMAPALILFTVRIADVGALALWLGVLVLRVQSRRQVR